MIFFILFVIPVLSILLFLLYFFIVFSSYFSYFLTLNMMGIPLHVNRNENDSSINRKPTQINQTRLAAVSNYKLAQLTFSPPKDFTLRKTALVKNLVEIVYQHTLNDYLTKPMTRWTFFTPESLEDMTQKDVEKVIYRYTQIIHNTAVAFEKKHIKKEQQFLLTDFPEKQQLLLEQQVHEQEQLVNALMEANGNDDEEKVLQSYYSTLFLQPNSIFSNESLEQDCSLHSLQQGDYDDETDSSFDSEKESATSDVKKESRTTLSEAFKEDNKHNINEMFTSPTHNFGSLIITSTNPSSIETNTTSNNTSATGNRLSWLSDTGVPDLRRFEGNNSSTTSL
ncbi:hypothetical protein BDF20DRAFT_845586, partial [Mycotypha africana]|uniref:uncharacterized protein n=1 Tax=Mycotypha africana TaxID=64632 RepID=UPI00230064AD